MKENPDFLSVESEMQSIDALCERLRFYEHDLHSDEVDRGMEIVHDVFDPHKQWFLDHGLVPTIHGSLLYHDPRKLDVDVCIFSFDHPHDSALQETLEQGFLSSKWPAKKLILEITQNDLQRYIFDDDNYFPEPYEYAPICASFVLTSKPMFSEQEPLLDAMRSRVRSLLVDQPALRLGVTDALQWTLRAREKRRGIRH